MRAAFALLLVVLAGCGGPVDLFVDLRTDMAAGIEFDEVIVTFEGAEVRTPAARGTDFVPAARVAEYLGVPRGSARADVELRLDGNLVVGRPVLVELDGSKVVTVVLTRNCRGVECPAPAGDASAAACLGGSCVDEECTEEGGDCGEPDCSADSDCPPGAGSCSVGRCAAGECIYADDGTCGANEFCTETQGCRAIPSGPADLAIENVVALWTTPNTVRWAWTPAGDNSDLSYYRIEWGTAPDALDTVVTPDEAPEMGGDIWFRPDDTVRASTFGHTPGSTVYARVVGVDWFGREAASEVAMAVLPDTPPNEIVIFADDETAGYSIPGETVRSDAAPYAGTHSYDTAVVCEPGAASCFEILRRQELAQDLSAMDETAFANAYLEFAVQIETAGAHSRYSTVRLWMNPGGGELLFNYEGWTIAATGEYRVYQVPLERLGIDRPLAFADLAGGLHEFGVGGTWPAGGTVRWDEVRLVY